MESDDRAARARQRALVQRGYDAISPAYRSDDDQTARSSARGRQPLCRLDHRTRRAAAARCPVLDLGGEQEYQRPAA
jgi:hypothetical protein